MRLYQLLIYYCMELSLNVNNNTGNFYIVLGPQWPASIGGKCVQVGLAK